MGQNKSFVEREYTEFFFTGVGDPIKTNRIQLVEYPKGRVDDTIPSPCTVYDRVNLTSFPDTRYKTRPLHPYTKGTRQITFVF